VPSVPTPPEPLPPPGLLPLVELESLEPLPSTVV